MTPNIESHAGAPLWPMNKKHSNPKYAENNMLEIWNINDDVINAAIKNDSHYSIANTNEQHRKLILMNPNTMSEDNVTEFPNILDSIKVADLHCKCDHKILYEQLFGSEDDQKNEVMSYKSCKHTIYAAAKRQMKAAPQPDPQIAEDFVKYALEIIDKEIGEHLKHFSYSYQQWYRHLNRTKQKDMNMVTRYFEGLPITESELKRIMQKNYEGICKVEIQGVKGKPRMVCSIPLLTKYIMGPVTWKLEEIFAHEFKGYCGGKNLDEMADQINNYLDQGFTKIVEGDGSAFDNTQDVSLKEVDRQLYKKVRHSIYHVNVSEFDRVSQELYKTMDVMYRPANSKKKIKMMTYKILGTVFSGDCDTTLCNTMRMALYNRYVNDKAGLVYGQDYIVFSKGDDFTVMYKPYVTDEFIRNAYYKYFLPAPPDPSKPDTRIYGLGQVLKMLDFGDASTLKFCSLRSWFIDGHRIMLTRDPAKFYNLSKYSRKTKTMNIKQRMVYLLEQAIALETMYPGIHIFMTMAKAYRQKAQELDKTYQGNNRHHSYMRQAVETASKHIIECREEADPDALQETPTNIKFYNIVGRKEYYKMRDDMTWWEMMKKLYYTCSVRRSEIQLKLINEQIDAEFSSEELKSVLGLYKEHEY